MGYWLFQEMGVQSSRAVHAKLIINGKYSGLYGLIEQVDGRFAKHHFDNSYGNVYKEVWPLTSKNEVQTEDALLAGLQTNEETPNFDIIREFGQKIVAADGPELKDIVKQYMDVHKIMSYAVVDRLIRHDDRPFYWYCIGDCINHNYYWYEEPTNKKLHLIPWDLDNAFVQMFRREENKPNSSRQVGENNKQLQTIQI
jgi:spore coat protein CotH